ncbi:MAG: hypothetical protein AAB074_15850 [Planctomycetota bacterium]
MRHPWTLRTPDMASWMCWQNLVTWVAEEGGGLILIAGEQAMPSLWDEKDLQPLLPVEIDTPLPESPAVYAYRLTDFGILSSITSFSANPAPSTEVWEDRDRRSDGIPGIHWLLATRCKADAQALVECGPEDRRMPLFVTRKTGRGRVFCSATDETWRWRFRSGDEPWFYPFWKRVIDWARRGE